jgi:hypothetical protein
MAVSGCLHKQSAAVAEPFIAVIDAVKPAQARGASARFIVMGSIVPILFFIKCSKQLLKKFIACTGAGTVVISATAQPDCG